MAKECLDTTTEELKMRSCPRGFFVSLLALVFANCAADDALLLVSGTIADPTGSQACVLSIRPVNVSNPAPYNQRQIDRDFSIDFTVAPKSGEFLAVVECEGYRRIEKRFDYTPPKQSVDLGELAPVRQ